VARGERNGESAPIARPLAALAAIVVPLGAIGVAVTFPHHVDRPILAHDELVSRRVDTMLGGHCELVRPDQHVRTPWPCGSNAFWPDGARDVIRIVDVDHRTCALDFATLETIGCVTEWARWTGVTPDAVWLQTFVRDPMTGYLGDVMVRIARASGAHGVSHRARRARSSW
jgi:hypothetical protein